MPYIDTKHLFKCETCRHLKYDGCNTFCDCGEGYSSDITKIPTADVVEVVRCEDCVYCITADCKNFYCSATTNPNHVDLDHFCSYGERKDT